MAIKILVRGHPAHTEFNIETDRPRQDFQINYIGHGDEKIFRVYFHFKPMKKLHRATD